MKNLLTEKQQQRLYLVHHMHHFRSGKTGVAHDLHHCFLFTGKKMAGDRYAIRHLLTSGRLCHVLDKNFSGLLYDHAGHAFKIKPLKIKNKIYSLVG